MPVRADVAELVDAHGSGPCGGDPVEVQVLSSAYLFQAAPVPAQCQTFRSRRAALGEQPIATAEIRKERAGKSRAAVLLGLGALVPVSSHRGALQALADQDRCEPKPHESSSWSQPVSGCGRRRGSP